MVEFEPDQLWMIIVGFIVAFVLAFGIGANDVANSFGTSVGAKVLTLRQACILGTIFETAGAMFLGAKVSDTIRKGIIDVGPYNGTEEVLMVGNVCALSGSCVWLLIATFLKLPVSGTHSIVGATVGFALVAHGTKGVNWMKMLMICLSWFVSPLISGLVSVALFFAIKYFILNKSEQLSIGLRFLPVFYGCVVVINLFSIFYEGPEMLHFDKIPLWGIFVLSFGGGILCAILVRLIMVPWQAKRIRLECSYEAPIGGELKDDSQVKYTFQPPSVDRSVDSSAQSSRRPSLNDSQTNSSKNYISSAYSVESDSVSMRSSKQLIRDSDRNVLNSLQKTPEKSNHHPKIDTSPSAAILVNNEYAPSSTSPPEGATVISVGEKDEKLPLDNSLGSSPSDSLDLEKEQVRANIKDQPETGKLFSYLQVLTAIFGSFAHGGNDVSNAIGPLIALWIIGVEGSVAQKAPTPIWILFYGGAGISIGLWVWGRRVIKTMGDDLTKITPSSGFCIEIGSALTVLVASNVGIPISTTHCKVGSIVTVGRFRARENVDWKIFRNIVFAWIVTVPISGGISAGLFAGLRLLVPH